MRRLTSLLGNSQRLDGGAMFGNVPRALWERWVAVDAAHQIPLACRCLLVEQEGQRILVETGIGAFFEPRLRERFGVVSDRHELVHSLAAIGLTPSDIDVVVLTHLHFDHAGGLLCAWEDGAEPTLLFERARFVVSRLAWDRSRSPHPRDRASFIPELAVLLERSGRLTLVDGPHCELLGPDWLLHRSHGHTPGLMLPEISMPDGPVLFAGDLVPGVPWVHLPVTMGYDRFPELLIDEKTALFADLVARRARLFFTHDPDTAIGRLSQRAPGRYAIVDPLPAIEAIAQ